MHPRPNAPMPGIGRNPAHMLVPGCPGGCLGIDPGAWVAILALFKKNSFRGSPGDFFGCKLASKSQI